MCDDLGHSKGLEIIEHSISKDLQKRFKLEFYGRILQKIQILGTNFSL
jgi:hypothetical protein